LFDLPREGRRPRLGATWVTGNGELCCVRALLREVLRKSGAAVPGTVLFTTAFSHQIFSICFFYPFFSLCVGGKLKRGLFLTSLQGRSEKSSEIM